MAGVFTVFNAITPLGGASGQLPAQRPGTAAYYQAEFGTLDSTGTNRNSGPIQTWKDQFASYDAVQTTTAWMPTAGLVAGRNALTFDGTDDWLPLATSPSSNGAFTIEAWIYQTSQIAGTWQTIYGTNTGVGPPGFLIYGANLSYSPGNLLSAGMVPLNTWTFVTLTYDGSTIRFYFNGVQDANSYATAGQNLPVGAGLGIGAHAGLDRFVGSMADVVTRTACLSAAQVLQEYQCEAYSVFNAVSSLGA